MNFKHKKSLGQNFLIDRDILEKIVSTVNITDKEVLDLKTYKNLGVIKNSIKRDIGEIDIIFKNLEKKFSENDVLKSDIVNLLKKHLPNFNHIETGKNLDSKM